jgi:hypothetical protein
MARHCHPSVIALIGLLCFCVAMQMLGAPASFWDMDEPGDLVESSLLEGFSLPAEDLAVPVPQHGSLSTPSPLLEHEILLVHSLFHPPLSHA